MKGRCLCLAIIMISLTNCCWAQQKKDSLVSVGLALYADKEYGKAANVFDDLVKEEGVSGLDFFNAARMWAMAKDADKAFEYLRLAFSYGFLDLAATEQSDDLRLIKESERFKRLVAKERAFQADSVISMVDVLRALIDRNVVVFENKRFVSNIQSWFDPGNAADKLIAEVDDERITTTREGLVDLRSKSLVIRNSTGQIHLNGLILKSLEIQNEKDLSINKNKPIPELEVVQLANLQLGTLSFNLYGQAFVRFFSVDASHVSEYMLRSIDRFLVSKCDLEINTEYRSSLEYVLSGSFGTFSEPLKEVIIESTLFRAYKGEESAMTKLNFNAQRLFIEACTFENEVSFGTSRVERIMWPQNHFLKPVDLSKVEFDREGFYMPYDQFENGLGVIDRQRPWEIAKEKILMTGTREEVKDKEAFGRLLASYQFLLNSYDLNGDRESGQQVYLKTKKLYLAQDGYNLSENPSFIRFIDLQINRFSGLVSNFGTSPGKVISVSFFQILLFSMIYLLFERHIKSPNLLKRFSNALMTSFIAQITLSPARKEANIGLRWVCLIQGLMGWSLFSFFLIALFNQA